jgi:16S rRNA (guanine966-N2)-methyltransferase
MLIASGTLKGRKVLTNPSSDYRPTSSKTKGIAFNLLRQGKFLYGDDYVGSESPLQDAVFADVFCGTGAVGFEAMSLGAKEVIFLDKDRKNIDLLRETAVVLKLSPKVISLDITKVGTLTADIYFIDPPYNKGLVATALKHITPLPHSIIIVEHHPKEIIDTNGYKLLDERENGTTKLTILQPSS